MAIVLTCIIGAIGSRRLGGTMVMVFFFFVHCCVCKWQLVLRCPPLSLVQHIVLWYYLGVSISIVVLDTYAILVKYLVRENGGREKNDKSVVCVLCCKKLLSTNYDFPNGKYETCICRNIYMCGRLVFRNIWRGKMVGEKNLMKCS
jgi:hypothetical protein